MDGLHFLGTYSGNSPKSKAGSSKPALWAVYLNKAENTYHLKKLDDSNNETDEQHVVSPLSFGLNFRLVSNAPLKKNIDNHLKKLDDEEDPTAVLNSLLKNSSAFNSVVKKNNKSPDKKSNEFSLYTDEEAEKIRQAKSNEPQKNSPVKKSEEFSLYTDKEAEKIRQAKGNEVHKTAPVQKTQEFQLNVSSEKNTQQTQENNKKIQEKNIALKDNPHRISNVTASDSEEFLPQSTETDQHPLDTKYDAKRFGFDSILNSLDDPKRAPIASGTTTSAQTPQKLAQSGKNTVSQSPEQQAKKQDAQPAQNKETIAQPQQAQIQAQAQAQTQAPAPKQGQSSAQNQDIDNSGNELLLAKQDDDGLSLSEKAQKLDNSLRAEFRVSLIHWNMTKKNMATRQFQSILTRQANFVPAHKHMFTDFAIQLRKINQHDYALQAATRATSLDPKDSHAFFNVARLYFELSRYEEADKFINMSLKLENDLAPAIRLSNIIKECLRRKAMNR